MAASIESRKIADQLAFVPKHWWDPIPPWFTELITAEVAKDLMVTQLKGQAEILRIQERVITDTIELIGRMK